MKRVRTRVRNHLRSGLLVDLTVRSPFATALRPHECITNASPTQFFSAQRRSQPTFDSETVNSPIF